MGRQDPVFTTCNPNRTPTYTFPEGTPETIGWEHVKHRRPELANKLDAIKKTVEETDIAFKDKVHSNRERLYCLGADSTRPHMYMVAVAEYKSLDEGIILTAWPTDAIAKNEGEITYVKSKK